MDNLSWGNPAAHRVRVHYNTASKKIYEGMPVCYNYDTTTNWAGGSVSDGAVTASTTLTAGTPETAAAKYLEVEEPNDGNLQFFAGVVAKGGWCGKTTSATANIGIVLDIYVPNGAIVPVRAGVGCTVARTVLSVIAATQYLGHALSATEARPVAIVEETVDRSTAGLILAKLDPNMFIYQEQHGSGLLVGTGATAAAASQCLNRIRFSTAMTAGTIEGLKINGSATAGTNSLYCLSLGTGSMGTATVNSLDAIFVYMGDHGANSSVGEKHALDLNIDNSDDATLCSFMRMYNHSGAVGTIDAAFYFANGGAESVSHLLYFNAEGDCLQADTSNVPTAATHKIKCKVGGTTFYLIGVADF